MPVVEPENSDYRRKSHKEQNKDATTTVQAVIRRREEIRNEQKRLNRLCRHDRRHGKQ